MKSIIVLNFYRWAIERLKEYMIKVLHLDLYAISIDYDLKSSDLCQSKLKMSQKI